MAVSNTEMFKTVSSKLAIRYSAFHYPKSKTSPQEVKVSLSLQRLNLKGNARIKPTH